LFEPDLLKRRRDIRAGEKKGEEDDGQVFFSLRSFEQTAQRSNEFLDEEFIF
jgi:hypothetical protein